MQVLLRGFFTSSFSVFALPVSSREFGSSRIRQLDSASPLVALVSALILLLTGCGGGSETYTVEEGKLAERHLPTVRSLDHHPDSVRALTITSDGEQLKYDSDRDYESLWREWSATYQNLGTGRAPIRPLSYATFWGLELSLASLRAEGAFSLTKEKAQEMVARRRKKNRTTIQIDVVWFASEGGTDLTGPDASVQLVVGDKKYRPEEQERGSLREALLDAGRRGVYRRNIFYFRRIVDGKDILSDVNQIELHILPTIGADRRRFRWTWKDVQTS